MTEQEWLTCADPMPMLEHLNGNGLLSDRRQRLLDVACVRRIWHLLLDEGGRKAVETAEKFANGLSSLDELREAQAVVLAAADAQAALQMPGTPDSHSVLTAAAGAAWEYRTGADPLRHAAEAGAWEGLVKNGPPERRAAKKKFAHERKIQAALLRDICGDPFQPHTTPSPICMPFSPVFNLAQAICHYRAFDRMPDLADALHDAGCDGAEILAHLRGPGPHVRGCWALDLILGKE
jgi:hypothetical protein